MAVAKEWEVESFDRQKICMIYLCLLFVFVLASFLFLLAFLDFLFSSLA
jgi:hypothetical protein